MSKWNGTEIPETDTQKYGQLIFDKVVKTKDRVFLNGIATTGNTHTHTHTHTHK
jgi:hypothetical protein